MMRSELTEEPMRCCRSLVGEPSRRKNRLLRRTTACYRALQRIAVGSLIPQHGENQRTARPRPVMLKFGRRLLYTGTPSPYPWDLSLSGNNGSLDENPCCILPPVDPVRTAPQFARRDGLIPVPPLPQLSRRSGRVPAEPYPPLSCDQYYRIT